MAKAVWVKENPGANEPGTVENDKLMKIIEQTIHEDNGEKHVKEAPAFIQLFEGSERLGTARKLLGMTTMNQGL